MWLNRNSSKSREIIREQERTMLVEQLTSSRRPVGSKKGRRSRPWKVVRRKASRKRWVGHWDLKIKNHQRSLEMAPNSVIRMANLSNNQVHQSKTILKIT